MKFVHWNTLKYSEWWFCMHRTLKIWQTYHICFVKMLVTFILYSPFQLWFLCKFLENFSARHYTVHNCSDILIIAGVVLSYSVTSSSDSPFPSAKMSDKNVILFDLQQQWPHYPHKWICPVQPQCLPLEWMLPIFYCMVTFTFTFMFILQQNSGCVKAGHNCSSTQLFPSHTELLNSLQNANVCIITYWNVGWH